MGDGHFGSTGFLGDHTVGSPSTHPPPSSSFAPRLVQDQSPLFNQELNYPNFQDEFPFGLDLLYNTNPAEVEKKEGDTSSEQLVFHQNESKRKRSAGPGAASENDDPRERKKLTDKRYREKVKSEKEQMKQQLDELKGEKGSLMEEIKQLREENAMMSGSLESNTEHMKQLSTSHDHLKRQLTRQESNFQALLSKLAPCNDMIKQKQESEKLRLKQALLKNDLNEVGQIMEELFNENMKLAREKMILEVNVEALCEKIHNDKHLN